jgi:hypothetical protein
MPCACSSPSSALELDLPDDVLALSLQLQEVLQI